MSTALLEQQQRAASIMILNTPPTSPQQLLQQQQSPSSPASVSSTTSSLSPMAVEAAVKMAALRVPVFVTKLLEIVSDTRNQDLVNWSAEWKNQAFVVFDTVEFSQRILPKYFKHSSWSSLVRQLNNYGFKKVDSRVGEVFQHPCFRCGRSDLLRGIQRRRKQESISSSALSSPTSTSSCAIAAAAAAARQSASSPSAENSGESTPTTPQYSDSALLDSPVPRAMPPPTITLPLVTVNQQQPTSTPTPTTMGNDLSMQHLLDEVARLQIQNETTMALMQQFREEVVSIRKREEDIACLARSVIDRVKFYVDQLSTFAAPQQPASPPTTTVATPSTPAVYLPPLQDSHFYSNHHQHDGLQSLAIACEALDHSS